MNVSRAAGGVRRSIRALSRLRRAPHAALRTLLFSALLATPPAAQVAPSGPWRTLHTQHFRIHFRPAHRTVAVETAAEAERAYALLASELHPPRGTIDLTLSDDGDAPNGFASTFPSNRVTMMLVPPVADPGLHDYDSWRRLLIVHELAHVFHLDRSRRLWGTLQSVFGRAPGLFPNQMQPSWVVEGLATYYESRFTGAGRANGSFHRQAVAADAAAAAARSPWNALVFTRWPGGLTPYAYGGRFWAHIGRAVGDSVAPRFIESAAGQLIPFRVGRPLRRAGAPRALTDDWHHAVAAAAPGDPLVPPWTSRLLVADLRSEPAPRPSRDGRQVAYLYDDGRGARRVRIMDVASGRTVRSHRVTGQVSYDWLGDTLIVAQLDYVDRWRVRSDLWRWLPGGAWRRATRGARLLEPRGGTALALGAGDNRPVGTAADVPDSPGATWGAVVPSPDARWFAASRHQDGQWALVRWRAAAPDSLTVLAQLRGGASDPAWRGNDLVFVSDVAGFPQIHVWTADRGVARLSAEPLGARAPAPLPDGSMLFTTLAGGGWELRVAPAVRARDDAARAHPLVQAPAFDSAPPVPIRETGYAGGASLRPHFWIPVVLDADAAGTFFGALTAGVDAVGRDAYVLAATVSPTGRAQGGAALLTYRLGNPTIDASVQSEWAQIGTTVARRAVLANELDAAVAATFVTRRWRRFASLRIAAEYEGARFAVTPDTTVTAVCAACVPSDLVGGSVSLTAGSVVAAPLTVSLQDGVAAGLTYRRREQQGTARRSGELRGRVAVYARLGPRVGFAYPVLAARVAAGVIEGTLPHRFSVGGVSSSVLSLPLGVSAGAIRTFPVRGYESNALAGRRAATASLEYRVPLALIGRSIGHLPLGVDKLSLTLFGDVGDAWDAGQRARLHRLRAAGLELVGDLTVGYDLPLRARVGLAQPAAGAARVYVAFAADF